MKANLRFKVGDRVTVYLFPPSGPPVARGGRLAERCTSFRTGRPMKRWTVRLDEPVLVGRFWTWDVEAAESELGPGTVPLEARPVSVGMLMRGGR